MTTRRDYWVPLVLLGFGLLGLLGWYSLPTTDDFGWFAYTPLTSNVPEEHLVGVSFVTVAPSAQGVYPARDWQWTALIVATLVATVAWYGWRARRAGDPVRGHVAVSLGGGIAVLFCHAVTGMVADSTNPGGTVSQIGLPLLALGALAGAWGYFRRGPWRWVLVAVSIVCLAAGIGIVLGAVGAGLFEPLVIAGGLLALARYERSRPLAVVTGAVLVVMLVFPQGPSSMLLPAALMLGTGVVVLVRQRAAGLSGQ